MVRTLDLFVWSRVQAISGRPPPPSCCQSMVSHNGKLFLFGGAVLGSTYNDVYSFDLSTSTWKYEETKNSEVATNRMSHTAVVHGDQMIVFAGMDLQVIHSDMLSLNLKTMEWSVLPCEGTAHPGCRRSHASVMYKDRMYTMMGLPGHPPPDLWCYDLATSRWSKKTTEQRFGVPPVSLHGHTLAVEKDVMFLFGGCAQPQSNSPATYFNGLFAYQFETDFWREVALSEGPRPPPRYSHVMGTCNGRLVVHGGDSNSCQTYFDDLWSIDVSEEGVRSAQWQQHWATGRLRPSPRSGHCAVLECGEMFIFGGEGPGDGTQVFYSGQLYRFPLSLSTSLPLGDLCARWLSKVMAHAGNSDALDELPPAARKVLRKYLPVGRRESMSSHPI